MKDQEGMAMFHCLKAWIEAADVSDRALYHCLKAMTAYGMNMKLKRMAEGTMNCIWPDGTPAANNYRESCINAFRIWEEFPGESIGSWVPDALCDVFQQTLTPCVLEEKMDIRWTGNPKIALI